jgi:uncharacterized protein (DUF58 family)
LEQLTAWFSALAAHPVLLLAALALPLLAVALWKRVFPSGALVAWAAVPCVLTAGILLKHDLLPLILAVDLALVAVAAIDLGSVPPPKTFNVHRDCQRIASLRKNHRVTLTVSNMGSRPQQVRIRDGVPSEFEVVPDEFQLALPPRSRSTVHYDLKASRRGAFELDRAYLRVRSRLGFWNRDLSYPLLSTINVYPDMKQLSEYALLARTNRLNLMGVRRTRRIGQDNEFERLRDYTLDDNYKHIDWRSTARRNKLTVKDFQTNQSQRVVFMLDCGRMMTNQSSGLSLLDHSLNALLMLSYVALQRGDSVGLVAFSDQIHSSVPARSGLSQMNHLLHAVYDRFPQFVESRYDAAFLHMSSHFRKRSLVVLMTNVIDDVNARQIHQYLSLFRGRHLPLAVLLRDHRIFDVADQAAEATLFAGAAAAEILNWRHQVVTDLQHRGVLVLDTFPESMTAPLINRYLEIKARHLL